MKCVLKSAIKHFGQPHQLMKTAEECSELAQACLKLKHENIIEEAADVTIMIAQLKMMDFWDEEEFKRILEFKANRLANRIAEEFKIEQREFDWKSN